MIDILKTVVTATLFVFTVSICQAQDEARTSSSKPIRELESDLADEAVSVMSDDEILSQDQFISTNADRCGCRGDSTDCRPPQYKCKKIDNPLEPNHVRYWTCGCRFNKSLQDCEVFAEEFGVHCPGFRPSPRENSAPILTAYDCRAIKVPTALRGPKYAVIDGARFATVDRSICLEHVISPNHPVSNVCRLSNKEEGRCILTEKKRTDIQRAVENSGLEEQTRLKCQNDGATPAEAEVIGVRPAGTCYESTTDANRCIGECAYTPTRAVLSPLDLPQFNCEPVELGAAGVPPLPQLIPSHFKPATCGIR